MLTGATNRHIDNCMSLRNAPEMPADHAAGAGKLQIPDRVKLRGSGCHRSVSAMISRMISLAPPAIVSSRVSRKRRAIGASAR